MSNLNQKINELSSRLKRLQAIEKDQKRKQDTRQKIILGGVVKAVDLGDIDPAILAGILITAKKQFLVSEETTEKFRSIGAQHLSKKRK